MMSFSEELDLLVSQDIIALRRFLTVREDKFKMDIRIKWTEDGEEMTRMFTEIADTEYMAENGAAERAIEFVFSKLDF